MKDQTAGDNFHLIGTTGPVDGSGNGSTGISVRPQETNAYRMRVDYTDGTVSDYVDAGSYTMSLDDPLNLNAATDADIPGLIDLTWSPPSGGTLSGYMLQYHSDGTAGPIWLPYDLDPSQIRDNGGTLTTKLSYLDSGATSWFRMAAIYDDGTSTDWGYASATTGTQDHPDGSAGTVMSASLQATAVSDTEIDLTLTRPGNSHDDNDVLIWWNDGLAMGAAPAADGSGTNSPVPGQWSVDDDGNGSAQVTGLKPDTHYYFSYAGNNIIGIYGYGDVAFGQADATTTGSDQTVPHAPASVFASIDPKHERWVDVHWTNSSNNETAFIIERSINGGAFMQLTGLGVDQTSYIDESPTDGHIGNATVQYRVRAVGSGGTESQPTASPTVSLVQEYISLLKGNDSGGYVNDAIHESVAAGHYVGSNFVADAAFSFGKTGWGWFGFKDTWLGWQSVTLAGYLMEGQIYQTDGFYKTVASVKEVSAKQATAWETWMERNRVGTSDVYSALRHNCVTYSEWEYIDAPGNH